MRRAAIIVLTLVTSLTFVGCDIYFDDDDRKNRPKPKPDGGEPDASCGPGHPDGGVLPDAGPWYPDAGPWYPDAGWPDTDAGY